MIQFKPWNYHQQVLMDQNPCYQYMINDFQTYYAASEHQEEEYDPVADEMPSETSSDQTPHTDTFRLAFEAAQWSKLVLNAEGLFNQLMTTYAPNEKNLLKNQIEQWLCLKQEYEECITGDDSVSLHAFTENIKRSLERIEEVTETDEKTDESSNWINFKSRKKSYFSDSEISDDEDLSDTYSDNSNFLDKLSEYKKKLESETDLIIDCRKNDFINLKDGFPNPKSIFNNTFLPIVECTNDKKLFKRKSILPNSEFSYELTELKKKITIQVFNKKVYVLQTQGCIVLQVKRVMFQKK